MNGPYQAGDSILEPGFRLPLLTSTISPTSNLFGHLDVVHGTTREAFTGLTNAI